MPCESRYGACATPDSGLNQKYKVDIRLKLIFDFEGTEGTEPVPGSFRNGFLEFRFPVPLRSLNLGSRGSRLP